MEYKQTKQKTKDISINLITIISAGTLLIGAIYIYLSNRITDMQLYSWLNIDTENHLLEDIRNASYGFAPWAKFNLPDGLWLLSFLLFMEGIWNHDRLAKWIFSISIISFAFISEILQFYGYLSGTGDIWDIVSYVAAVVLLLIFIKLKQIYYEKNN